MSSGKTTLAKNFAAKFGAHIVKTRDVLIKDGSISANDRLALQAEGDRLDRKTQGKWVLNELSQAVRNNRGAATFVVDSVRTAEQIVQIRAAYRQATTHLHLTAALDVLKQRYGDRYRGKSDAPSYDKVRENPTENNIGALAKIADIVIYAKRCTETDILARAAGRISLYGKNNTGYVDVVIGGQYGSEGKGQIAGFLAKEYDLLVRVGGPNAGHTVYEYPKPYIHKQLPSGTLKCDAPLLLGPGMVIDVEELLREISQCGVEYDRLSIDLQATIIQDEDKEAEKELVERISSTGQGVGRATARRITERGLTMKLARDVRELKPYLRSAYDVLTKTLSNDGRILLEGTQGTGLSLYHGEYPYVTSRDTTVSGCLADAGIPSSRVRRVVMVCRTYPIRVGGDSGPMSQVIDWKDINERSGVPLPELLEKEKGSVTRRLRRVGEFDWAMLRKSAFINGATDIALNFTDYLSIENRQAKRFEQLTQETRNLIEEIEHVTKARVSLIGTGFDPRSIIDRRDW